MSHTFHLYTGSIFSLYSPPWKNPKLDFCFTVCALLTAPSGVVVLVTLACGCEGGRDERSRSVSPLQSFLIVCDPATSRPGLLVVSAGGEQPGVLDYHIKTTGTGTCTYPPFTPLQPV